MYTEHGKSHRKEGDTMPTVESNARWKKENTINVSARLMNKTDTDIIEALENRDGSIRARLIDLLRKGVVYEQTHSTANTADPQTEQYIRLGKEYKKLLDTGCVMVDRKMLERKTEPEKKAKPMIDLRKVVRGTVDNPGSVPDPE